MLLIQQEQERQQEEEEAANKARLEQKERDIETDMMRAQMATN